MAVQLNKPSTSYYMALFILLLVTACNQSVHVEEVVVLEGHYSLVDILPDNQLLLDKEEPVTLNDGKVALYVLDDQELSPLSLPDDDTCVTGTYYERPSMLPDGRLGLVKFCVASLSEPLAERGDHTLIALDLDSYTIAPIMEQPLYSVRQGSFTWNPDMSKGVMSVGYLAGTLHWLTPQGPEPMQVWVGDGQQQWSLAEALKHLTCATLCNSDSLPVGIARTPDWSLDGSTIAFTASPAAMSLEGPFRLYAPYRLYLMDVIELKPNVATDNLYQPQLVRWSPDSQRLLLDACAGLTRRCGLWIYSLTSGSLEWVTTRDHSQGVAWLSESEIVMGYCVEAEGNECRQTAIREIHLDE